MRSSSRFLLVEELKRTLRGQKLTYAQVAHHLGLSLPTIKRMFSRGEFTLARFERICEMAGTTLPELAAAAGDRAIPARTLTLAQERQLVADPALLLVTWLVLNRTSMADITRDYRLDEPQVLRHLIRLDRMKVIELQPGNKVRLLVNPHFSWRPGGPVQRYIHERMLRDFLDSRFTGEDEQFWFHGGRLTDDAMASLRRALQVAARECAAVVDADRRSGSPRSGAAFVIALRRWAFSGFEPFER